MDDPISLRQFAAMCRQLAKRAPPILRADLTQWAAHAERRVEARETSGHDGDDARRARHEALMTQEASYYFNAAEACFRIAWKYQAATPVSAAHVQSLALDLVELALERAQDEGDLAR
jgi:hypothetical protein